MLVFMLYDEAIRSLQKAVEAIDKNDIQGRWQANKKAVDIIGELAQNLDMEKGGLIAEKLYQLYRFLLTSLPQVDIRNDPKPAEEAVRLLEPLRDSWRELARKDSSELARERAEALVAFENTQDGSQDGAQAATQDPGLAPAAPTQSSVKISA